VTKPIWYLDVDGVVNIARPIKPHDIPDEHWRDVLVTKLPIRYDQRVVDFINRVHRDGNAEIVWLTTWERKAIDDLAPVLELDEFRLPSRSLRGFPEGAYGWWKWESVKHHTDEDDHDHRDIIWTDDDLAYAMKLSPAISAWHDSRDKVGLRTLGISPRSSRGLTPAHLAVIEEWIG